MLTFLDLKNKNKTEHDQHVCQHWASRPFGNAAEGELGSVRLPSLGGGPRHL